ncbi:hypothetical protein G6F40_017378 [Rhizopus arrhizus]|nr:hypothetical protein G6F40_017378 [Rhizopus arrhizus]
MRGLRAAQLASARPATQAPEDISRTAAVAEVQPDRFGLADAGGQEHPPIALARGLVFKFLQHAPRDALAAQSRQRPDPLELGGLRITVRHEGTPGDRNAVAQQQYERAYR